MFASPETVTAPGAFGRIVNFVRQWRAHVDLAMELKDLNSTQARRLLEQRGVIQGDKWQLSAGAISIRLLAQLMRVLNLNPDVVARAQPDLMGEMERNCAACAHRGRCERDLEGGRSRTTYKDYCPNAGMLDGLRLGAAARA
jgi:hypothetical protein